MKNIRVSNFHKVLALLLTFATLLPVVFASNIIPFADNGETNKSETSPASHIGATATFVPDSFKFFTEGRLGFDTLPTDTFSMYKGDFNETVVIADYMLIIDEEEGKTGYYKVAPLPGESFPENHYASYCWVHENDLHIECEEGVNVILGSDGKPSSADEPFKIEWSDNSFRAYYTAASSLQGNNVRYQWQIRYDIAGDKWANISGASDPHIKVTYGIMKSLLDEYNRVTLRCISTDGIKQNVSGNISVELTQSALDELHNTAPASDTMAASEQSLFTLRTLDLGETLGNDVMPLDEGGAKQTYNIIINYVFENNEIVSDPYTANLAEGSSFSTTVTFPTVQGYLPYVNDSQNDSIELNYTSVSENVTINVVYKPTNVNYTVIHYQQNVDNDNYTEVTRETLQGLTGSQVPEVHKDYEGFYHLLYEQPAIAADGSTVIEIYYDRYYYLMNFDMDGGYGTDPVYARYGATIGDIKKPTKAGYAFKGWSETEGGTTAVEELPETMPVYEDGSKTYYAIWEANSTAKVTVVFWGENADDEKYSYLSDYTKEINLKPGSEFTYSESGMLTCGKGTHTHSDECYEFICTTEAHEHNSDCYTCGNAEHKHSVGCYPDAGSSASPLNPPNNPKNGQVYSGSVWFVDYSYIYINGSWYNYSGSVANGDTVSVNCGMTEHTHTTACIGCGKTEHEHTRANCYKLTCKEEEHTHTSACYEQGAGLDSTLWKVVKSDTITVAADGSSVVNVYYDRVEYSVQFYENQSCSSNREYTSLKITAKWGQNILEKWPTYNGSSSWYVKDKSNTWQNSIQVMPVGGAKFWGPKSGNSKYTATYYVEILDGEKYDVRGSDGRYYKVHHTDTSNSSGNVTDEERYGIDGFTINNSISTSNGSSYGGSKFYYTRNSYKLTFNDQYTNVKTESVKFEAPLSTYKDYVPEVPSAYEPGSVEFGGWYQNPQCTGEEYKLEEHKMPANDIILYAKWVPVERTVKFYLTESSTEVYHPTGATDKADFTVPHGGYIAKEYVESHLDKASMKTAKPNGEYVFVMWYYYEDGVKKPFDPTTQIRKDLTLYGEWSSNTLRNYTVQYVLKDDHSVKVADDLTGAGLAGTTKTFDAKGGTDLYAAYQEGYFPTVQSQSLLLDIDKENLVITFEYVPMPSVPYTVKYVEKDTGKSLADDKVVSDNRKAVVTETFKPISGYMPDAYQKRLVVTADGENILYFYYTKDTEHAYYKITHYIQNTDGTTWSEYAQSQVIGDIGTRYTASPMTIPGYTYKEIKYVVNGTEVTDVTAEGAKLTADGLEINLYYVRNEYPYQVRYLEQGSGKVLHDPKNGTGKFGQVISESAIDIDGYDKVDPTSATLNIRIDEGEGAPKLNIITFYYKEKEVTINYVAVGPDGATDFGSVNPTTETVKVTSGTAQGSTATPGNGFKFVGWYKDAACTQQISTDAHYTPAKVDGKNVAATYYAKFEYDVTSLTIKKELETGTTAESGTKFIFDVKLGDKLVTTVTIAAGASVTINGLKVGETYTVTERDDWAWRYNATCDKTDGKITLAASGNTITFTNTKINDQWLDKDSSCVNSFKNKTETPAID